MKITLKEKIELGEVVRIDAAVGNIVESYQHIQGGRGVNAVLVEVQGGSVDLAHDIAVHIAFARPKYLSRDEIPADVLEKRKPLLRPSAATKVSLRLLSPKLSKVALTASTKMCASLSRLTPKMTSSQSRKFLEQQKLFASPRLRSAD